MMGDEDFLQRKEPKPAESQTTVAAREAPPSIMQYVMICLCADIDRDQLMLRRPCLGLATRDQVWSWTARSVFDDIGNERSEDNADGKTEYGDVHSVGARLDNDSPKNDNS